MRKLIEIDNERATKLYQELRKEIQELETEKSFCIIRPAGQVSNTIGIFKSTRTLGNCNRHVESGKAYFKISLNKELVKKGTDKEIKDVLTHELIHTLSNCFNHGSNFKNKAIELNYYLGYNGIVRNFSKQYVTSKGERDIVYKCSKCGKLFYRYRHINTDKYVCPCKGKLERVLTN